MRVIKFTFLLMLVSGVAFAGHEVELGAGIGGQYLADYRGSKETQLQVLPFPVVIYRGDFLKIDREGIRGELFASPRFEFNVSADLALNGDSDDNTLRRGMPELDSAFQFGPSFNINLTGPDFDEGFAIRLPARAVFTVSSEGIDHIGYTFNPKLTYERPEFIGKWRLSFDFGLLYGSNSFHDYYYSVEQQYATPERPYYNAQDGYSGTFSKLAFSSRHGNLLSSISLRYDNLSGAEFVDSPLVETEHFWMVSFGVAWVFREMRF